KSVEGVAGREETVIEIASLPKINAALNATSALLLTVGYVLIRRRRVAAHRACMLTAFFTSSVFLACYLTYHVQVGHVPYSGVGTARVIYFCILVSHVLLAALILPLSLATLYQAFRRHFERHRRIA